MTNSTRIPTFIVKLYNSYSYHKAYKYNYIILNIIDSVKFGTVLKSITIGSFNKSILVCIATINYNSYS